MIFNYDLRPALNGKFSRSYEHLLSQNNLRGVLVNRPPRNFQSSPPINVRLLAGSLTSLIIGFLSTTIAAWLRYTSQFLPPSQLCGILQSNPFCRILRQRPETMWTHIDLVTAGKGRVAVPRVWDDEKWVTSFGEFLWVCSGAPEEYKRRNCRLEG